MKRSVHYYLRVITFITCLVILIIGIFLSSLTAFYRYCENNPLDFVLGTRVHVVRPRVYDARFDSGTLVLVRRAAIDTRIRGDIISMVYNNDAPFIFNNERFIEFQEEYYGLSLHGIVTEDTLEQDRLPLRGGHYVGVPFGSISGLGSLVMWINYNLSTYYTIAFSIFALAVLAFVLVRVLGNPRKTGLPKPKKKKR